MARVVSYSLNGTALRIKIAREINCAAVTHAKVMKITLTTASANDGTKIQLGCKEKT